jgi:hypothetical protein
LPHSEIRGSKAVQRLTAAYRSRPRPSSAPGTKASTVCPYYLDGRTSYVATMQISRCTRCHARRRKTTPRRGLSKLNSVRQERVEQWRSCCQADILPGHRGPLWKGPSKGATSPSGYDHSPAVLDTAIPRKEVIQPHLPVRLPCYDFTPITEPTFDGSLPCGLGHRLRVFPAFVV